MAGMLPSFMSSAMLEIRMGSTVLAYCQSLAWSDDMTNLPVGGIGSYSYHTLEPVAYSGRGSTTITHYSTEILNKLNKISGALPANLKSTDADTTGQRDGNSLLIREFFSPMHLILGRTFDIKVYERSYGADGAGTGGQAANLTYTLSNCRMTNFGMTFTVGSLLNQSVSFMCLSVTDHTSDGVLKGNG